MGNKPFYHLVNSLYKGATSVLPENVKQKDVPLAFTLGLVGSVGLVYGLEEISEHLMTQVISNFHTDILPILKLSTASMVTLVPLSYAYTHYDQAVDTIKKHTTYVAGMTGAVMGGLASTNLVSDLEHVIEFFGPLFK